MPAEHEPAALLEGLNDPQRAAVTSPAAPLCILAGAGTGKTRVLTRRIAHRVATADAEPHRVLALTFTRKAAGELRSRLRGLGLRDSIAAGTFHGLALAQLRAHWADRGARPPDLLDRKVGFVARLLPRGSGSRDIRALDAAAEIEWAAARRIAPDTYADAARSGDRRPPLPPAAMAEVYHRYIEEKRRRHVVDFDDLLALMTDALHHDRRFADTQRWRFRHVFVDEFQDVNRLQFDLLRAWLGDRTDLCVVGDPRQAIYGWNGADARYLTDFARHFPGGDTIELRHNYRSTPEILHVANAIIRGRELGHDLSPTRPSGAAPVVRQYESDQEEAHGVARAVREQRSSRWANQAVLVRTNSQAALLADALGRAGVPARVRGGPALLDRPEVRDALARMVDGGLPFDAAVADLEAEAAGRTAGPEDDAAVADEPVPDDADELPTGEAERRADLTTLAVLARDYQTLDPAASVAGFRAWVTAAARFDDGGGHHDAVDVATFHAAKGLEWDIVHVAGVEQGLVPISRARTGDAQAEERRLFYVALTRARRMLRISWAGERTMNGRTSQRQPSPYLAEVDDIRRALDAGREPVDNLARVREERAQLLAEGPGSGDAEGGAGLSPEDRVLLDALKAWRRDAARAASVPAFVIFRDETLAAVAAARPRDEDALLALPGIGPVKAARYGETLLALVHTSVPRPPWPAG